MAITIDLLPGYVNLRRWFKRILSACLVLVGTVAFILFVETVKDQQLVYVMRENLDAVEKVAVQTEAAQSAAAAAKAEVAPIQAVIDFISQAGQTGAKRAELLDLIRQYIKSGVVVTSIDVSDGQNVKLALMVKTPDEYGAFLTNLRHGAAPDGTLFDGLPSATGIPGFPPPDIQVPTAQTAAATTGFTPTVIQFPLAIKAQGKLKDPITVPVEPAGGGAAASGPGGPGGPPGAPGLPGAPPGPPGAPPAP